MTRKERFYLSEGEDDRIGRTIVLRQPWSSDFISVIERENIRCLRLSFSAGWKDSCIDFLNEVPKSITGFEVYSWKVSDLSPFMERKGIEHLSFLVELKRVFDLGELVGLRTLKFLCSSKSKNLEKCDSLEHLNIMTYPSSDIKMLASMQRLERLQITSRKLNNVEGISNLSSLRLLDFAQCAKLVSLEGIEELTRLEELELTECKAVGFIPHLASLKSLKSLIIEDCGTLPSLRFLAGSESLERVLIIGRTEISDRDLTPLKSLPNLKDVRVAEGNYNLSRGEILEAVGRVKDQGSS